MRKRLSNNVRTKVRADKHGLIHGFPLNGYDRKLMCHLWYFFIENVMQKQVIILLTNFMFLCFNGQTFYKRPLTFIPFVFRLSWMISLLYEKKNRHSNHATLRYLKQCCEPTLHGFSLFIALVGLGRNVFTWLRKAA